MVIDKVKLIENFFFTEKLLVNLHGTDNLNIEGKIFY